MPFDRKVDRSGAYDTEIEGVVSVFQMCWRKVPREVLLLRIRCARELARSPSKEKTDA